MKTIILILTICLLPLAGAQTLLEKTEAQREAEQVDDSQAELVRHVESQLLAYYAKFSRKDKAQRLLDALGTKAAAALQRYSAARAFVVACDPLAAARIPAPDLTIYVINQDGTVTFNPPPDPIIPPVE